MLAGLRGKNDPFFSVTLSPSISKVWLELSSVLGCVWLGVGRFRCSFLVGLVVTGHLAAAGTVLIFSWLCVGIANVW